MSSEDDLARRLAALRSSTPSSKSLSPSSTSASIKPPTAARRLSSNSSTAQDGVDARLAQLHTPTDEETSFEIPVQAKNVDDETVKKQNTKQSPSKTKS